MFGFKQWNIDVVSRNVRKVPRQNYIEQITRTFKDFVETKWFPIPVELL